MSTFFVNGPCAVQVGTGASFALEHLGFTKGGVRVSLDGKFEDVHSDYSGPMLPADEQFFGEEAYIRLELNRYNEAIYVKLAARLNGATEGTPGANSIGTLLQAESKHIGRCLLLSPYQAKTAYTTMPAGYNFLRVYAHAAIDLDPLGTKVKEVTIILRAMPIWDLATYTYTLYNHTITGAAAID